jgi:hypothetical protein
VREGRPHKHVAREERKLHELASVLPAGEDLADRKKRLHLSLNELLGDRLLVSGSRVEGVPTQRGK